MTDSDQVNGHPETDQPPAPEVIAQALRLRSERPQVTRLSRKMLAGAAALALVLVSGPCCGRCKTTKSGVPRRKNSTRLTIITSLTVLAGYQRTMPGFRAMCPD